MVDQAIVAKLVSVIGMLVEGSGFAILSWGVWRANQDQAERTKKLSAYLASSPEGKEAKGLRFETLTVDDELGIEIRGGAVEEMAKAVPDLQFELNADRRRLLWGVGLTAIGLFGQMVGTVLQP